MRKIKKWRYYCDFCKKSGCSGHHMEKHERHCCRNPGRECRMCVTAELEQQPTAALVAALEDGGLEKLKQIAQECPACILAGILQYRVIYPLEVDRETGASDYIEYDFKAQVKSFWEKQDEGRVAEDVW